MRVDQGTPVTGNPGDACVAPTSRPSPTPDSRLRLLAYPFALAPLGPHPGSRVGVRFGVEDVFVPKRGRFPGRADELEQSVGSRRIHGKRIKIRFAFSHPQHGGPGLPIAVGGSVDDAHDLLARVVVVSVFAGVGL